jgi:hypothetical protein
VRASQCWCLSATTWLQRGRKAQTVSSRCRAGGWNGSMAAWQHRKHQVESSREVETSRHRHSDAATQRHSEAARQPVQASKLGGRGGRDPGLAAPCAPATERSRSTLRAGALLQGSMAASPLVYLRSLPPQIHQATLPPPLDSLASPRLPFGCPVPLPLFGGPLITHCFWQVTLITEAPPFPQTTANSPSKRSRRQQRNTAKPRPALPLNGLPKSTGPEPRPQILALLGLEPVCREAPKDPSFQPIQILQTAAAHRRPQTVRTPP